uniref:FA domain-containing protein n=1 Tax=Rhabditophanes sp. KR3021 TaxID=114890 RepID=A0AC35TSX8_9BILA
MEHHIFFRLIVPPLEPSKSLFSLGSRYRYSGRTEYQSIVETKRRARVERAFMRANSKTGFLRSTIAIGSRNDSSTSSRTTTFSQPNTATTTVSTMSNNLDSALSNADVEYCVKTSMNNGHYHPKIDEDNISNNSAKGSTYNTWTNGNICNVKRTASFLRRNFSLKRGGLNMFTSNSSSSSISSLFMKMIPKGSTSAADIATNKTDTIDEQFMRILRHRPIQEIGATHNHSDLR